MAQYITRRSESDILAMAPLVLRLGKENYTVPLLANTKAQEWRVKLYDALSPIVSTFDFSQIDANQDHHKISRFMNMKLSEQMLQFPERLLDLIFAYGPDLPQDDIRNNASDEQIAFAFAQCSEVGYPFFFHLYATQKALATPVQQKVPLAQAPSPGRTM